MLPHCCRRNQELAAIRLAAIYNALNTMLFLGVRPLLNCLYILPKKHSKLPRKKYLFGFR